MPNEKNTTDLRAVQAHHEVGGMPVHFKSLLIILEAVRRGKGGNVVGEIDGEILLKMAKMKTCSWF